MRLAGYQPQYFPRLHYFNRILNSDVFEISDYVQFVRKHAFPQPDGTMKRGKSFQAHTVIKNDQGPLFLAIPTHDELLPINKTKIDYSQNWANKHLKSIEVGYRKALNFSKLFPEIEEILNQQYLNLGDLTVATVFWGIIRLLTDEKIAMSDVSPEFIGTLLKKNKNPFLLKKIFLASESPLPPPKKGEANDWIIALCKHAGADEYYYGGTSHSAYMDIDKLEKSKIKGVVQNWQAPSYRQQYMKVGFLPNLSVIDLVMNENLATRQELMI
ncbi:MAG: hypothetical protein A3C30_00920 [Candidatus Levybacteria bacterium RIFCSPHIGHO2_02_FULL_40_18]|nr:MAG: hypothetical protein A2869_03015 [Candidatus Levybacteria bacterium RIFCSPHIGHO2_01_FULL_40_58]OGH27260.1 MAG: hypothetical protein A3C30_00920 [Candidatus Levybacteria bacterium RIFCSPHIGHO2_02_FULL_40_18]OGH31119.1 MAG: hypothetical protein A3E43_05330 [Candidatus Levybacteria bacterium RIFCSPHIGHO2_12_FULL_40_31]OGH40713.1 MAG: hypothetical protein A2894_03110 [Candidatus Levybacteria bacterium RIFCSPLOWO2_01_FULL_40_64]OGH49352.1 MAG: hypothetical protein A3I54_01750 [Candidatus Lev